MSDVDEARKRVFIELHGRLARAVIDAGHAIPGEREGTLRVDPYLAAANAMRVLPKVVFFDEPLRLRLHDRFGPSVAKELLALLGEHASDPGTFDGSPDGPQAASADGALTIIGDPAGNDDWIERAIADGVLPRERTQVGLSKDDIFRLVRSRYANYTLLVRFRTSKADGRRVMSASDVVALALSNEPGPVEAAFVYKDIRDIFPLCSVDETPLRAQVV